MLTIHQNALAFVVIDFQTKLFPSMKKSHVESARENIVLMLKTLKLLSIPCFSTEQYVKGLGPTDELIKGELGESPNFEKMSFSCLKDPQVHDHLQRLDKKTVILSGMETHICVLQTAFDLLANNYEVIIVKDAVVSSSTLRYENGLELMQQHGAIITNCETLLFQLLGYCHTPQFKAFAGWLKERNRRLS